MQDEPTPTEILGAVAEFLRVVVVREGSAHTRFQARVAASALELVRRQLDLAPAADSAERDRLQALLGRDGSLGELNAEFAARLASGALDMRTPAVAAHLWATTLAKLAVDQPNYSGYRAARAERAPPAQET
jgi:hypothetical protein